MLDIKEVPAYITIVSKGSAVLTYGQHKTYAAAVRWCGRAMKTYPTLDQAEQIAIARPTLINLPEWGNLPSLLVVEGWLANPIGWERATEALLRKLFDHLPAGGPQTLLSQPPAPPGAQDSIQEERERDEPPSLAHLPRRPPLQAVPDPREESTSPHPSAQQLDRLISLMERLVSRLAPPADA